MKQQWAELNVTPGAPACHFTQRLSKKNKKKIKRVLYETTSWRDPLCSPAAYVCVLCNSLCSDLFNTQSVVKENSITYFLTVLIYVLWLHCTAPYFNSSLISLCNLIPKRLRTDIFHWLHTVSVLAELADDSERRWHVADRESEQVSVFQHIC